MASSLKQQVDAPAFGAFPLITHLSDSVDLPRVVRGFYVGGTTGDVKVDMVNGDTVTFSGCVGGMVYPFAVRRVYLTGTTATALIGLY